MPSNVIIPVKEIPADGKRVLESMLGRELSPEQHVLILAYTPSAIAEAAAQNSVGAKDGRVHDAKSIADLILPFRKSE